MSSPDTLSVINSAYERISREIPESNLRFIGGVVTDALVAPGTEFDLDARVVRSTVSNIDTIRANGTPRDLDILSLNPDPDVREQVEALAVESLGRVLVPSVNRVHPADEELSIFGTILGVNVVDQGGQNLHVVGPFHAKVPEDAMAGWTLALPEDRGELPILTPRYHMLSYSLRSIGGVRPKDRKTTLPNLTEAVGTTANFWTPEENMRYRELEQMSIELNEIQLMSVRQALAAHGMTGLLSKFIHRLEKSPRIVKYMQLGSEKIVTNAIR